jgi:hypothetical protein
MVTVIRLRLEPATRYCASNLSDIRRCVRNVVTNAHEGNAKLIACEWTVRSVTPFAKVVNEIAV